MVTRCIVVIISMYANTHSLCDTPKINIMFDVNYTLILKEVNRPFSLMKSCSLDTSKSLMSATEKAEGGSRLHANKRDN